MQCAAGADLGTCRPIAHEETAAPGCKGNKGLHCDRARKQHSSNMGQVPFPSLSILSFLQKNALMKKIPRKNF